MHFFGPSSQTEIFRNILLLLNDLVKFFERKCHNGSNQSNAPYGYFSPNSLR